MDGGWQPFYFLGEYSCPAITALLFAWKSNEPEKQQRYILGFEPMTGFSKSGP